MDDYTHCVTGSKSSKIHIVGPNKSTGKTALDVVQIWSLCGLRMDHKVKADLIPTYGLCAVCKRKSES